MEKETIKPSELKPGNLVIGYSKEVEKIRNVFVHSEPCGSWPSVSFKDKHYCNYTYDLTPIRITEEWLNRLGFTIKERWPSNGGDNFYKEDRKVQVSVSTIHGVQVRLDRHEEPCYMIDYVHELQNIYKELTGEELDYVEQTING